MKDHILKFKKLLQMQEELLKLLLYYLMLLFVFLEKFYIKIL